MKDVLLHSDLWKVILIFFIVGLLCGLVIGYYFAVYKVYVFLHSDPVGVCKDLLR